ncbi:ABC transporter permease subunit [Bacillus salacetis]|uniref:ABC transporter permease subunit n=1 Tax=Bacillus salacetis TaxID=2315464 RepID=A0A3A1QUZ2_9BACI|nr:ABC transporter permease subunit [Bacillus salacetis]RIW31990.1 ABC transporter permease subunit [Bacillus salacetis]
MLRVFRQPLFILGFTTIFLILAASIIHDVYYDSVIPQTEWLRDSEGNMIAGPPLKPAEDFPLGTDEFGYHMLQKLLQGAKYTFGAAFLTSLLGFLLAFLFGVLLAFWKKTGSKTMVKGMTSSFYFIPQSIIAYNILHSVLWEPPEGFAYTLTERIIYQIVMMALILAPTTALLIAEETREILKKEFIESSITLGASRFHIFRKHVFPHLRPRLSIIYPRIVVQVLLIIAHLGIFQIYFGGTSVCYDIYCDPPMPIANEWSGLLGMYIKQINYQWWLAVGPLACFTITILAINSMAAGIEKGLTPRKPYSGRWKIWRKRRSDHTSDASYTVGPGDFDRVSNL